MLRLANDRRSSSTTVALRALELVARYALERRTAPRPISAVRIRKALRSLGAGQPEMAIVQNVVVTLEAQPDGGTGSHADDGAAIGARASALRDRILASRSAISRGALELFRGRTSVVTLSYSSEVESVLRSASALGRIASVRVGVDARDCEGHTLVSVLRRSRIDARPVAVLAISDAARRSQLALVGADAVGQGGTVICKVGARALALACHLHHRPFYVTTTAWKMRRARMSRGPRPERPLARAKGRRVGVRPLFERIPTRLVTGYLTELGILEGRSIGRLARASTAGLARER